MPEQTFSTNEQLHSIDPKLPQPATVVVAPEEVGGRGGLDPTRYGDWEKNGRCIDF